MKVSWWFIDFVRLLVLASVVSAARLFYRVLCISVSAVLGRKSDALGAQCCRGPLTIFYLALLIWLVKTLGHCFVTYFCKMCARHIQGQHAPTDKKSSDEKNKQNALILGAEKTVSIDG